MSLLHALLAIVLRDAKLGWVGGGGAALPAAFFAGASALAPFALGPDPQLLTKIGPGFLWLALALSALVSLERLFQGDLEDGTLDQLALSGIPLTLVVAAKVLGQWLAAGAPLVIISPILALLLQIPPHAIPALMLNLALGGLGLFFIGSIPAALAAGVRRGGLLAALLALPLYAPPVIFGAAAASAAASLGDFGGQPFLLLCAFTLAALATAPPAAAAGLRLHLS